MKNKIIIFTLLIIILISFLLYNKKNNNRLDKSFFALDTNIMISLYNSNNYKLLKDIENIVNNFENIFSKTKINSELHKINNRNNNDYIELSSDLAFLFEASKYLYNISNNKFDISLYDCIELWTRAREDRKLPSSDDIKTSIKFDKSFNYNIYTKNQNEEYIKYDFFYDLIEINNYIEELDKIKKENKTFYIKFDNSNSKYDFGAIAKGYIADYLKYYLKNNGIKSAIINLGGNVLCLGKKNIFKDFNVGINKPFSNNEIITTVKINNQSCVTSGIYERYFETDDTNQIWHHILDNDTGYPIYNDLYSVTIISNNSIIGDSLSTICMLCGVNKSSEILDYFKKFDNSIHTIFIDKNLNLLEK